MAAVEKLSFAGDVQIRDITIITTSGFAVTITPQVATIEIYEDLFSPFISGKMIIRDSQELTNLLPLVGEEIVRIDIGTPSISAKDSYRGEFYIYKMDDRIKLAERELAYVLHFTSKECIIDVNKKISKAYSGKVSEIANKILTDDLETKKPLNIEETKNVTKYVSNFWSITRNLQYLCDNALNINDSPTYVFFENKYGLNFVSLDALYSSDNPVFQKFIWDNYSAEMKGTTRDLDKDYQRILEIRTPEVFNYLERLKSGMYGSEMIAFDLLTKQYMHVQYQPNFSETKHLNEHPLWSSNAISRPRAALIQDHRYYNNFDGFDDVTNSKSLQKRTSLMTQAEAFRLEIVVFGRTDYSVGQKVYVELPKNTQIKKEDLNWQDKVYSGNYLIAAICHRITRTRHECVMELIKDSYGVNLDAPK